MVWEPQAINEAEQKRTEERAAVDARQMRLAIWRDGLVGTRLEPVAIEATHAYIAARRQESAGIPRWAWVSQEAMQQYIQMTGDRYYFAFLQVLGVTIGRAISLFHALPLTREVAVEPPPEPDTSPPHRGRTRKQS